MADTDIVVAVPVPRAVRGQNIHLIVEDKGLELVLVDDPTFGVISGKFAGTINPTESGWQLGEKSKDPKDREHESSPAWVWF